MGVLILLIALLWVAATALIVGWRGRRVDDHPLCGRCGFDLIGRPTDSTRCSECGADLTPSRAIVIGHRQRRPQFLALGTILLLGVLAGGAVQAWISFGKFNLDPYKPFWWLKHDLLAGGPASADALLELMVREGNSKLSRQQVDWIADTLLAKQTTPGNWTLACGTFLETAHWNGELDRTRWGRYGQQSVQFNLKVRPNVRQGEHIPLEVSAKSKAIGSASFLTLFDWDSVLIDGKPISRKAWMSWEHPGHDGLFRWAGNTYGSQYWPPRLWGDQTRWLTLGPHRLSITLHLFLYNDGDMPRTGDATFVPSVLPIAKWTTTLSGVFNVVDAAHGTAPIIIDAQMRDAVRASIKVDAVIADAPRSSTIKTSFNSAPLRLEFNVFVRDPQMGHQWPALTEEHCPAGPGNNCSYQTLVEHPLIGSDRVDVLFEPAQEDARQTVDDSPIWGEPVVFHDIPVQHPAIAPPNQ